FRTAEFNNALIECQARNHAAAISAAKKNAIAGLMGNLMGGTYNGITSIGGGQIGELYTEMSSVVMGSTSTNIKNALRDLFDNPNDYPRSCTLAIQMAEENKGLLQELIVIEEDYKSQMERI